MIIFRKSGNFYQVFDDDAIILHSLFKYKINEIIDRITLKNFFHLPLIIYIRISVVK